MDSLPENADSRVRRYFEYYNRRLQGESVETIAQALGLPLWAPEDLYELLRADGFPVCEVCGETPASARHCRDRTSSEKFASMEAEFPDFVRRSLETLCNECVAQPFWSRRPVHNQGLKMRLKDNRKVRVRLHPWDEERKYRAPQVVAETSRADRAITAALVVLEGKAPDPKRVPVVLALRNALLTAPGGEVMEHLNKVVLDSPTLRAAKEGDLEDLGALELPLALLRHYRPDFDAVPEQDRVALLQRLCGHINNLIESARKTQDFLERGGPGGLPRKPVKEPARCILAAELTDALELNSRQVGEVLNVPLDQDYYALKGSNKRSADMASRGRDLLMQVFGDDEVYEEHMRRVRPPLEHSFGALVDGLVDGNIRRIEQGWAKLIREGDTHLLAALVSKDNLQEGRENSLLPPIDRTPERGRLADWTQYLIAHLRCVELE